MKALVYAGVGQPMIEERAKPAVLKPTDAIIKMTKTTICGTDLHIFKGDVATCSTGTILGHEGIGIVDQVGEAVKTFKPGDRVIISAITSCSSCENCRKGMPSHCADGGWILGNLIDGTQAEYVRIPHADGSLSHMVGGASDLAQVMLSDVLPTAFECGVLKGQVQPGSTVAIVGGGPIGLGVVMTCQLFSPFKIIVIDFDENRLATAKSIGATDTVVSGPDAVRQVMELTGGRGVDTVVEAVGIPATFELCQDIVAAGGNIANVGVHGVKVDLHLEKLWDRNITITTRVVDNVSAPMLVKLVDSGRLQTETLVTHQFSFSDIGNAYGTFGTAAQHKCLKVIINF